MKRFLAIALVGTIGLIYSGTADAGTGTVAVGEALNKITGYKVGMAANGIGMSRHNFGGFGEHVMAGTATDGSAPIAAADAVRGTTEICVFCHTPHHAKPDSGPLWNRKRESTGFKAYGTTIGQTDPSGTLNPESAACLSCHDGVSTFDMLVNSPGKGFTKDTGGDGKDSTGTYNSGSNADFAYQDQDWFFTEKAVGTGGFGNDSRLSIGADDVGVAGMTADLSNDHPIGIAYTGSNFANPNPAAVASLRPKTTVIANIDLDYDLGNGNAIYNVATFDNGNLTQNKWALYGFISNTAKISQLLKGTAQTVECGTCHDPHFSNKSWGEYYGDASSLLYGSGGTGTFKSDIDDFNDADGLFLRRVGGNSGSGLCRTCHNK